MKTIRLLLLLLIAGTLLNTSVSNAQTSGEEPGKKMPNCDPEMMFAYGQYCFTNEFSYQIIVALCTSPTYKDCSGGTTHYFPLKANETSCFYRLECNKGLAAYAFVFSEVDKFIEMKGSGKWENLIPKIIKPILIEPCIEKHMVLKP